MNSDPELFTLTRSTRDGGEVVTLVGELDMAHASTLAETLDALADSERPVIVDLSELTFIQRVLNVTKIDRVLPVYESLDAALEALG